MATTIEEELRLARVRLETHQSDRRRQLLSLSMTCAEAAVYDEVAVLGKIDDMRARLQAITSGVIAQQGIIRALEKMQSPAEGPPKFITSDGVKSFSEAVKS